MIQTGYGGLAKTGMWGSCYAYFSEEKSIVSSSLKMDRKLEKIQFQQPEGMRA